MLRRRILASAMASVMAIGSVAVVANAEDAAAATTQVKTKADLEAYVKSFDTFREDGIYDYGSISGENFLNAIEYADNVLEDSKSTVDDYTTAYAMIEAVYNRLKIYTAEELKKLVDSSKSIYETNNVYNEDIGDAIYTAGSFSDFEDAYDEADSVLASEDSRVITDAYEQLDAAKKNLNPLEVVTKAQFRTALKNYETALQKEFAYETWRVGTVDTGWAYWGYQDQTVAFGTLYEHAVAFKGHINAKYDEFDQYKSVNKTSQVTIVEAYKACVEAGTILNGFKADDTNRATKANVKTLLGQYNGRLVYDFCPTSAEKLYEDIIAEVGNGSVHNRLANPVNDHESILDKDVPGVTSGAAAWWTYNNKLKVTPNGTIEGTVEKLAHAEMSIKSDVKFYIEMTKDGFAKFDPANGYNISKTSNAGMEYSKLINAKMEVDLTDYIRPTATITTGATPVQGDVDVANDDVDNHHINNVVDGDPAQIAVNPWGPWQIIVNDDSTAGTATLQGWSFAQIGKFGYIGDVNSGYPNGTIPAAVIADSQDMDGDYGTTAYKTYTELDVAYELALLYVYGDKDDIKGNELIERINSTESIIDGSAKGSSAEWTMVYRYLKYALADKYDASYGTHTKKEVEELIEKAYELAELTGDAALFSVNHDNLVDARQEALAWVKGANKDRTYKDNVTPVDVDGGYCDGMIATQVYDYLNGKYNTLMKDYKAFEFSFEEIYLKIADVKSLIDEGELEATDDLKAALENTAYYLSVVEDLDVTDETGAAGDLENSAFTTDRIFQGFNRVFVNFDWRDGKTENAEYDSIPLEDGHKYKIPKAAANGTSKSHENLANAYVALMNAVKAQLEPAVKLGDVNKDGVVNALDAAAILKAVVDGTVIDVAVGDYNADGTVNALDASAILKAVVNGNA